MSKRPEIIESPILARLARWRAENERREAELNAAVDQFQRMRDNATQQRMPSGKWVQGPKGPIRVGGSGEADWRLW